MIEVSVITGVDGASGTIPVHISNFPCGERKIEVGQLSLPSTMVMKQVSVNLKYESDQDLIDLLLIVDAIKRCPWLNYDSLVLYVTYFPYSRQDRVCNLGEPHSLRVICDLINTCGFDRVYVVDPHSDVIEALINNVDVLSMDYSLFVTSTEVFQEVDAFVSPDAGAYKKVSKTAMSLDKPVVRADKIRDTKTGALSGFEVYSEDLTGQHVIILDDICDGGGTFIGLAEKLREKGAKQVDLYVTHGMFTKGVDVLLRHIDNIYCYGYHGDPQDFEKVSTLEFSYD